MQLNHRAELDGTGGFRFVTRREKLLPTFGTKGRNGRFVNLPGANGSMNCKRLVAKLWDDAANANESPKVEQEFWKTIESHPKYQVSSEGRVRNVATNQLVPQKRRASGGPFRSGMAVNLLANGAQTKMLVKHLVIKYIGGADIDRTLHVVNTNGNEDDCRFSNLEVRSIHERSL